MPLYNCGCSAKVELVPDSWKGHFARCASFEKNGGKIPFVVQLVFLDIPIRVTNCTPCSDARRDSIRYPPTDIVVWGELYNQRLFGSPRRYSARFQLSDTHRKPSGNLNPISEMRSREDWLQCPETFWFADTMGLRHALTMIPMRASPLQLDQIGIDSSQPTARPFDGAKEQIKYLAASPHNMVWKRLRGNPLYQLPSHVERVCRVVVKDVLDIESIFTCFGSNSSDDGVTLLDVDMFSRRNGSTTGRVCSPFLARAHSSNSVLKKAFASRL